MEDDKILSDDDLIASNDEVKRLEALILQKKQEIQAARTVINESEGLLSIERRKILDHGQQSAEKKKRERPPKGNN